MQVIALDHELPEIWTIGPAVEALRRGQLVVFPTDTIYALACDPWDAGAVGRLYKAKGMAKNKRCAVLCADLKQVGQVARAVSTESFRFLRTHLPGPYTVLLHAARDLPRQATGKRKTIGVRMSDHPVAQALVEDFGRPILVTSLPDWIEGQSIDPVQISNRLRLRPACVLDQGPRGAEPSTVVDFTQATPELVRAGKGEVHYEV